ncbi:RHS repeat-associated core domain-containing protein [Streptomyces solicathayae]|uniref:RHS repeat-associated core domain-containing protein n=1 Tax=Streptomyces solicathayae TaxID=3081768 RepID=A0ABZ0LPL2_9ACTN|nr:RHS repeat-associated core domain-containing protein [Streptomyces sp. HUAS YS2]WOX21439.1 RHS repeat-associated core domain-containing protein [Streptomyces sp. HUAS YS2]
MARAAAAAAEAPTTDDAVYAYDAVGRMVGITDPTGETARYRYDAAGNRLAIERYPSSTVSVLSVVPVRAAVGQVVTLSGTGFSTTLASNTVKFGTVNAQVVSASTPRRLTVKVPAGAVAGKVSVTVGTSTAASSETFTPAAPAPVISRVEPDTGYVGAEVVVTGSGFADAATDNVVRFGGGIVAQVKTRTDTALTVFVPPGAVNGQIEVETRDGRATSATTYQVRYGTGEGQIESSETTSVTDTTPPTLAVTTPGNRAQVLFDADKGEDIDFAITNSTFTSTVTMKLYDPQGSQFGGIGYFSSGEDDWEVHNLPLGGRYSLILEPGSSNIGGATVTLSNPATAVLDLAGLSADLALSRAGQDGKLTFDATLGQSVSLAVQGSGMTGSMYARLYDPDGIEVSSASMGANRSTDIDVDALAKSGTYTLRLDPDDGRAAAVKVTGSRYVDAGTLDPVGPDVTMSLPRVGQNGFARFAGEAGQGFHLGVASTGFASWVELELFRPDGTRLSSHNVYTNGIDDVDFPVLPATGTYMLRMAPDAVEAGTLKLTLSRTLAVAPLSTTGAPVAVDVTRAGQTAESVVQGTTGDTFSLAISSNTFSGAVNVDMFAPSGANILSGEWLSSGQTRTIGLPALTETGAYRVVLNPDDAATGALSLSLSADAVVNLTADGPSAPVALNRPGQRARVKFTAPSSGVLGLALTGVTFGTSTELKLFGPAGGSGTSVATVSSNTDDVAYLPGLTAGAAYTVVITPSSAGSGNATLWLSKPVAAGALTGTTPKTGTVTRPGQRLEFTLDATAGDGMGVALSGNTLGTIRVLAAAPGSSTENDLTSVYSATGLAELKAPLAAGTHRVIVQPFGPTTGAVTATLLPDVNGGALSTDGTKRPAAITTAGQNAHYTFTGTAGQKLTLGLDAPPYYWYLTVTSPNGTKLVNERSMSDTTLSTDLPTLPETGTYTVVVDPWSLKTGTWNVGLTTTASPLAAPAPKKTAAAGKTDASAKAPGVVPSGADAWQPAKANLAGRDWITERGSTPPKAPAALRAAAKTTALTGRVLKLDGKPLPKVTVTAGGKTSRTDAQGRFLLAGISPEATTLIVNGESANTKDRSYGRFDIHVQPKAGQTVDLGFPVWMTPLDTKHTVKFAVPAKTDVVLKTPQIPGLEVRIPKGSVVRDDKGKPVTELGITAIPIDRPPFPLPKNSIVPVYFTVQPGGTYVFPKGAQIVYPNYTREAPGKRVEFLDYDPKKKGWYVYGHGTVTPDGRQVVPDADTRVWAFHGAMFNTDGWLGWATSWLQDAFDWLSGDPVELSTGYLTDRHTDLAVADRRGNAEVTRTYWQGDTDKRAFGIGRDLIYNAFLHSQNQWQEVDLYLPGGSKVHYVRTSPGAGWGDAVFGPTGSPGAFEGTKIANNGDGEWELTFRDGTVWTFPQYAPLAEIRDRHGNKTKITRVGGNKGDITQVTTAGGRWVSFEYDAQHRVKIAADNTGRTTSYTYDSTGRLETVTDPAGKISSYTYDGTSNRIKTAKDARGIVYMSNVFYASGRVQEQTLTEGQKYTFTYTLDAGRVAIANVTQPGGALRRVYFDTAGYGYKEIQATNTAVARTTAYTRDPATHRVTQVTDPYGRKTDLTYDANGYVTSTAELVGTTDARASGTTVFNGPFDQPTKYTDPLGNATTLAYDAAGNLDKVTDPEGRITQYDFEPDGQLKSVTAPDGSVTSYTYRYGDLVSVKDPQGRVSSQFHDAAGRRIVTVDNTGSASRVVYDVLNQARSVTDPLGQALNLDYDDNGNLTSLTDARGNSTSWTYDQADRPKTATDPYGSTAGFEYHPAGQVSKVTDRMGRVATAEYDLLGRAKNTKYNVDLAGQAESTVTYEYDAYDLPKKVSDTAVGDQSFTYDVYDRTKTVTGPTGTVVYDYDNADRRKTMTAGGVTTAYGYDRSSILTSVKAGTQEVTFGLDPAGREQTATYPGGMVRTTGYETSGAVKSISYAQGATSVGTLTYNRDANDQQIRLRGTLASVAVPAAESGSVFGKDNRLSTFNGRTFTYDNEGQLTGDGNNTYAWNTRGELTGVKKTTDGTSLGAFGYDPLGGRASKTLAGATTKFLTDGSNPAVEQNAAGDPTATVTASGLDEYLLRTENGKTQTYLTDALGTVVGLANADGTVATRYTYDPYGQPTASGTATSNPYTFTGREEDKGTGLLYYRNRYYQPETGRFISQDPIGHAGGPNLYQYALSSPTNYTDPSGNNPLIVGCIGGAIGEAFMDWGLQRLSGKKVDWGQVGSSAAMGCGMGMLGGLGSMLKLGKKAAKACEVGGNSFTGDTPVLMADATHKSIKDIQVGDQVLATDPETGETGPRAVTALIQGTGDKQLVDITVDTDGVGGSETAKLTATDGHPFWAAEAGQWTKASDLKTGQWLQTSSGTWIQVAAVNPKTASTTVYNLTVDNLHTYYALAGQAPTLVHNCSLTGKLAQWIKRNSQDDYIVYHGLNEAGDVIYAGITNNLARRKAQHIKQGYGVVNLVPLYTGLRKWQARGVEQILIERVKATGLSRVKNGKPYGQNNSINPARREMYDAATSWARDEFGL